MKTLTQEEKLIALAEANGWVPSRKCDTCQSWSVWRKHNTHLYQDELLDYFNDMNALMSAWEALTDEQKTVFARHIRRFHDGMDMRVFAAFKHYGAEALGLTLGAWEEGQ